MIKGAFVFAAGLAVGTVYGFGYGLRISKAMQKLAEAEINKKAAAEQTVQGDVVSEPVMDDMSSHAARASA